MFKRKDSGQEKKVIVVESGARRTVLPAHKAAAASRIKTACYGD